jgi:hypothetical protein
MVIQRKDVMNPLFPLADDRSSINAHIIELPAPVAGGLEPTAYERGGGDYFPVWLHWLPSVGDLIELNSRINAAKGPEQHRRHEVVRVVHVLEDVFEDSDLPHERHGSHFVELYVRLSTDELFNNENARESGDDDPPA